MILKKRLNSNLKKENRLLNRINKWKQGLKSIVPFVLPTVAAGTAGLLTKTAEAALYVGSATPLARFIS